MTLFTQGLVQTINSISCYRSVHSILVSLIPPYALQSILTGQRVFFKGSSSPPVAPISFRVKATGPFFLSDSHVYSISSPHWPPCCFLNTSGVLGACTWGAPAWTAPFLQISTWLTHSLLQVFVQKSPLWNLLTTLFKIATSIPLSVFSLPLDHSFYIFYYIFYTHLLPLNCRLCEFLLIKYLNHLINWNCCLLCAKHC